MCSIDDAESWAIYRESTPRARVEHYCSECGRVVRVGETYRLIEGMLDDGYHEWTRHKTCQHCLALSNFMMTLCNGYVLGDLVKELVEHWYDGYRSVTLARWIAGCRRGWHGGLDDVPTGCGAHATELMRAEMNRD